MLIFLNRIIKKCKPSMNATRGQVAIILLLVIGMGLVFYAASMNLGGLSQSKLMTTIASNVGASQLGFDQLCDGGHCGV